MSKEKAQGADGGGVSDILGSVVTNKKSGIYAVWIASFSNINFPSRRGLCKSELEAELDAIVSGVADIGANTLFFQVRPCGDALYKSDIFPF